MLILKFWPECGMIPPCDNMRKDAKDEENVIYLWIGGGCGERDAPGGDGVREQLHGNRVRPRRDDARVHGRERRTGTVTIFWQMRLNTKHIRDLLSKKTLRREYPKYLPDSLQQETDYCRLSTETRAVQTKTLPNLQTRSTRCVINGTDKIKKRCLTCLKDVYGTVVFYFFC